MYTKDSGKYQYGAKTVFHIPPNTVMAYSVVEMTIECDGYFGQWHLLNMTEQHYCTFWLFITFINKNNMQHYYFFHLYVCFIILHKL